MRHILIILIGLLITVSCQKDFYLEDLLNTEELLANSRASHRDTSAALNALLDDANSEIAQLVDELTVVNAELMTSEEENADLLEQVSGLTLDLEDLQGVANGLTSDIARLTADLDAELTKNDANAEVIADLTDELNDLQAVYDELVANPVVEIQEVIRTVVRTVSVPGPTVTETVTNTVYLDPTSMEEIVDDVVELVSATESLTIQDGYEPGVQILTPFEGLNYAVSIREANGGYVATFNVVYPEGFDQDTPDRPGLFVSSTSKAELAIKIVERANEFNTWFSAAIIVAPVVNVEPPTSIEAPQELGDVTIFGYTYEWESTGDGTQTTASLYNLDADVDLYLNANGTYTVEGYGPSDTFSTIAEVEAFIEDSIIGASNATTQALIAGTFTGTLGGQGDFVVEPLEPQSALQIEDAYVIVWAYFEAGEIIYRGYDLYDASESISTTNFNEFNSWVQSFVPSL